jgi:mannose-6-phosphate isomerase
VQPEMALAITPFRGFCGFRPLPEIAAFLKKVPEFGALISDRAMTTLLALAGQPGEAPLPLDEEPKKIALREVFECLMTAEDEKVKKELAGLVHRYRVGGVQVHEVEQPVVELVQTLEEQFPGDVGSFCSFLLNVVSLEPGEAVFLRANEPHAYISGGEPCPLFGSICRLTTHEG